MKKGFAIGCERDGTPPHAQRVIFQLVMGVSARGLFPSGREMQKQKPTRENSRDDIQPARVVPDDVRMLDCARRSRSTRNPSQEAKSEVDDDSSKNHCD